MVSLLKEKQGKTDEPAERGGIRGNSGPGDRSPNSRLRALSFRRTKSRLDLAPMNTSFRVSRSSLIQRNHKKFDECYDIRNPKKKPGGIFTYIDAQGANAHLAESATKRFGMEEDERAQRQPSMSVETLQAVEKAAAHWKAKVMRRRTRLPDN